MTKTLGQPRAVHDSFGHPSSRATQCAILGFQTPSLLWSGKWRADWIWETYKELERLSISLKNCDNNFAEIYAIYKALSYFKVHCAKGLTLNRKIHVFTDSRNTIDMLTFVSSPHRYRRIIDIILHMISSFNSPILTLHWIPSHTSYIESNIRNSIIGNEIADKLAGEAAEFGCNTIDIKKIFMKLQKNF